MKYLHIGLFALFSIIRTSMAHAEPDWVSITVDNDVFVGDDSGYTNGVYLSWYDVGVGDDEPDSAMLVRPLRWTLAGDEFDGVVNAYTLGQAIVTPKDITVGAPTENDLPYSGLLFLNSTYLVIHQNKADKLSTIIGIVGPSSGAKSTQKWLHEVVGADDPKGWDSQLKDEVVFKFTRGRIWQSWASAGDCADFLFSMEAALGTIESSVSTGIMLRYGQDLRRSFAAPLLISTRTSNSAAIEGGWYVYIGLTARHIFNQIFTNGNTFRDSPSIDFKKNQLGATAGLAYSWQSVSLTLAVNDTNVIEDDLEEQLQELTRYGTLTLMWRY